MSQIDEKCSTLLLKYQEYTKTIGNKTKVLALCSGGRTKHVTEGYLKVLNINNSKIFSIDIDDYIIPTFRGDMFKLLSCFDPETWDCIIVEHCENDTFNIDILFYECNIILKKG